MKDKREKMRKKRKTFEIRADDVMPYGKYCGITLRELYGVDPDYFNTIAYSSKDLTISDKTIEIITSSSDEVDKSFVTFSRGGRFDRIELKSESVFNSGRFNGKTLLDVFLENETFYRYLIEYKGFFVSEKTFEQAIREKGDM